MTTFPARCSRCQKILLSKNGSAQHIKKCPGEVVPLCEQAPHPPELADFADEADTVLVEGKKALGGNVQASIRARNALNRIRLKTPELRAKLLRRRQK